jgi:outer membrane biogenesis lipoprotein LolB
VPGLTNTRWVLAAATLALLTGCQGGGNPPISSPSDVECPQQQTWITYAIQGQADYGALGDGECGTLYEDGSYSIEGTPGCLPRWPCDTRP